MVCGQTLNYESLNYRFVPEMMIGLRGILKLKPHSRLTEAQQRVARVEFGFTSDVLEARIRKALEFYTEHRWGLEQKEPRRERVSIDYVPMSEEEIDAN